MELVHHFTRDLCTELQRCLDSQHSLNGVEAYPGWTKIRFRFLEGALTTLSTVDRRWIILDILIFPDPVFLSMSQIPLSISCIQLFSLSTPDGSINSEPSSTVLHVTGKDVPRRPALNSRQQLPVTCTFLKIAGTSR